MSPGQMLKGTTMKTDALTNPIVKDTIEALQNGDGKAWSALFEPDAELYDDALTSQYSWPSEDAVVT